MKLNAEVAVNAIPLPRRSRPVKIRTDPKVTCGACGAVIEIFTNVERTDFLIN